MSINDVYKQLRKNLEQNKVVLLGEMHGAQVNPIVIGEIVKHLKIRLILIEVNSKYVLLFSQLRQGTEKTVAEKIKEKDAWLFDAGVLSLAHLRLYARLRKLGVHILPVKIEDQDWSLAEVKTSDHIKRILANKNKTPTLAVFGNLHMRKLPFALRDDGDKKRVVPMGWHLRNNSQSIHIRYAKGVIKNFGLMEIEDKGAYKILGNFNKMLTKSHSPYFDFDYVIRNTKPLK